jgi:hypothetical protein
VSETLSIGWELEHPMVFWDGGRVIEGQAVFPVDTAFRFVRAVR